MNDLITNNLNLVPFVIKKMNIFDMSDYEDYYQVGVIGLIYASKKYNKDLKISFSTFAYVCIKNEILKFLMKNNKNNISLDEYISEDITIKDIIADENCNIIEEIMFDELCSLLHEIINNKLSDIEKKIIKMYYGIGCREYKQKEIADILNIKQYTVSRIKNKAIDKLRKYINN